MDNLALSARLRKQIDEIDDYHRATSINVVEITADEMLSLLDELNKLRKKETANGAHHRPPTQ